MIYTVTLNPAIDYILSVETILIGEANRYQFENYGAGGKGINVTRLLTSFGLKNTALGFIRGFSGAEIAALLEHEGCRTDFICLQEGHSRINIKICEHNGIETDLNGAGYPLPSDAAAQIIEKLKNAGEGDLLILAGSLPAQTDQGIYAAILKWARGRGISCIVDAAGEALLRTLPYAPFLIKPNEAELGELFDLRVEDADCARDCAEKLQDLGTRNVVVSMGGKGALLVPETGQTQFYSAIPGTAVSTVGAGDSMIAGILYGLQKGGGWDEAMRWGICAGAATAFRKGIAGAEEVRTIYRCSFHG